MNSPPLANCQVAIDRQRRELVGLCRRIQSKFGEWEEEDEQKEGEQQEGQEEDDWDEDWGGEAKRKVHDYENDKVDYKYTIPNFVVRSSPGQESRFLSSVEVTVAVQWTAKKRLLIAAFFAFNVQLEGMSPSVPAKDQKVSLYIDYKNDDGNITGRLLELDAWQNFSGKYTRLMGTKEKLLWRKIGASALCCAVRFVQDFDHQLYGCLTPVDLLRSDVGLFRNIPFELDASAFGYDKTSPDFVEQSNTFVQRWADALGVNNQVLDQLIENKSPLTPAALRVANAVAQDQWRSWYPLQEDFVELVIPNTNTTFDKVSELFVQTVLSNGLVEFVYKPLGFRIVDAQNPGQVKMATTAGQFLGICHDKQDFVDPRGVARVGGSSNNFTASIANINVLLKMPLLKITTKRVYRIR